MSKNKVQFLKGMCLTDFMTLYGSEKLCRDVVYQTHWPNGFRCPECGHNNCCEILSRQYFQCRPCHYLTSLPMPGGC